MWDDPDPVLLVAASTVAAGLQAINMLGFDPALALGWVRVVTEPHGLRGWRYGTKVMVISGLTHAEMREALMVCIRSGRFEAVTINEAADFIKGVMG